LKRQDLAVGLAVGAALGVLAESLELNGAVSYWGPRSPVIVGFAVVTAALWGTRLRAWLGLGAGAVALLWLVVAFTPLTSWMARDIVRRDSLREADAVVVLASSLQTDGELTAPAQSRLVHGLELLAEGRAPRLVLTEIAPPSRSYAEPARALMGSLHVEGELIAVGPVKSTRDEALAVARLFAERGLHSLILVTSPTHTRRAAAAFEKQGLTVMVSPAVETLFDLETLDSPDDRLRAFGSLLHERLGLWLYAWRGDIAN
jgi:uncharacterized SAM-binding protein YcdF (DUF218 family)